MRLGCAFLKRGSEGRAALLIQLWWKRFVDVVNARTSSTYKLINEEGRAGGGGRGGGSSDAGRAPSSGRGVGAGSEEDAWRVQMMSMMHPLATRVEEHIAVSARGRTALATRLVPRGLSAAPGATPRATPRTSHTHILPRESTPRSPTGVSTPEMRRRAVSTAAAAAPRAAPSPDVMEVFLTAEESTPRAGEFKA